MYFHFIVVCIAMVSVVTTWLFSDLLFSNDDQFILYRYIDNLAQGNGFVYNIGERVLGSTTPLFTLFVASIKFLLPFLSAPTVVALCNSIFFSLSAPFFHVVASKFLNRTFALVALGMYILLLSRTILEGMETALFLLILFALLTALYNSTHVVVSVLLAALVLTRPDAGIIAIFVGIHWLITRGFVSTVKLSALSVATFLPWAIFATGYFGSFIPQSLVTKLHSSEIYFLPWYQSLKIQVAHVSKLLFGKIFDFSSAYLQIFFHTTPIVALVFIGLRRFFVVSGGWLIPAIPVCYLILFSISNPIIFPWYLSQTEPFWIMLIVAGVEKFAHYINKKWVQVVVVCIVLIGPLVFWVDTIFAPHTKPKATLLSVGAYIAENAQEHETVGIADIGIVGYVSGLYVHDFIGLVRPDSVSFYYPQECIPKNTFYTVPPLLIAYTSPDWFVSRKDQISPCFYSLNLYLEYSLVFVDESGMVEVWKKIK